MSNDSRSAVMKKSVVYDGADYTRDSLQEMVKTYQDTHSERIQELESLKNTHDTIAKEMTESLVEHKSVWECLKEMATGDMSKAQASFRGLLERVPLLRDRLPERPLSELLQEKIHLTETRIREVGAFLDRMESEVENVRQDIARLNKKMVVAAQNEEKAAQYILQLRDIETQLVAERDALGPDVTAAHREKDTEIDEVKRLIWEHGAKLRLYANAEDRISNIVKMNNGFMGMLTNLHTNMQALYDSGQEVLDELRGNLASLTTATEASELTMDMQKAMKSLKESVNKVAVLASNTSLYLTQNVEKLTAQMRVYDDETQQLVNSNLAMEREIQEKRIDETLRLAEREYSQLKEGSQKALPGES